MPKVSIIIPVYNAENFIRKSLDSVVNQTFKDIEIICINDGSKDNSLKILKEFQKNDARIVIIDKINEGVSAARNDGVNKSIGEYITFVDADDWLEFDAIESAYNAITEKNVDVVNFNCYLNDSYADDVIAKGNLCGFEGKLLSSSKGDFIEQVSEKVLKSELNCAVWLLMIKREVLLKTSLFAREIHFAEDCILYNELLDKINTIYFLDKPLYHYYQNPISCTKSSKYYVQNIYSSARAYERLVEIIKNDKFKNNNRIQITTDRFGEYIMNTLFLIYLDEERTNKDFMQLLKELVNDEGIVVIIKNTNVKGLPLHISFPYKLLAKRKYKMLVIFYNFRKKCRNFMNKMKNK